MTYNRSNAGAAAAQFARKMFGVPYQFGGTAPGPTDCAGFTQWAYAQVGISIPRTSEGQYLVAELNDRSIPNEVGDLLFIPGDPSDANPGHVVIFFADGHVGHTGEVYEAEETGTLIGEFPFDTRAWEFRSRPALLLPPPPAPAPPPTEDDMNPVITKDPNNGGEIILDTAAGTYNGISDPATSEWLQQACKISVVPAPSKAVFAKFKQVGTI